MTDSIRRHKRTRRSLRRVKRASPVSDARLKASIESRAVTVSNLKDVQSDRRSMKKVNSTMTNLRKRTLKMTMSGTKSAMFARTMVT